MIIGIDGRELCGRATGVGRYLAHLLQAWDRLPAARAHRFVLYLPQPGGEAVPRLATLRLETRLVAGGSGTRWEQLHLPSALRGDRPDVLFAPAYTAPIATRVPVVLTLHDLSFVAHPEWFPPRDRYRRRLLAWLSARRARRILTDAEFSRTEVENRLGIAREKVRVIPLAVTRPPAATGRPANGPNGAPPPRRTVLFVGSIFNRRHLPELIEAFGRVAQQQPDVRLEIVGDNRTYPRQDLAAIAAGAGVGGRTTLRSYVTDEVLDGLYAGAGVFAFLSDYEGFGLTPLEALSAGVPILVGDTPVAREVYGDAAAFVAPTDVAGIARDLERLLSDAAARAALLARAPAVLGRYSWERTGRETLDALVEAARA